MAPEDNAQAPVSGFFAWYAVIVLMLAQTVSFIDRMIMGLLVGPIRKSFDISDTQYSLLAGLAFAIFYSIMGIPLARIADRSSRKRLVAIAITFWSLMTALCGMAKGFWSLFVARIGVGVGEAVLSPAAYSIITDYFEKKTLARALSVYTLGVTIGSGLAYVIGGLVVTIAMQAGTVVLPVVGEREGWQLTFFLVGAPGLLVTLLILLIREPMRRGLIQTEQSGAAVSVMDAVRFIASRKRALFSHILGVSLFIMVVFSLNIWGPEYLMRTFGFARGDAGRSFGVLMMIAGTGGLMLGGALGDRWFAKGIPDAYSRVILLSMAGMWPFVIALGFVTTPQLGLLCMGVAVFFSAFQGGIAGGLIQLITPNQLRGQTVALYFLTANLIGMGLGPTVVASATDYVFKSDAALNKSIALCGGIVIPLAGLILLWGLPAIRKAVEDARSWE
ncbi:MAG: MFS transporter [Hyphomonas sp.]|nr:MFS transporter [Hyphomonas sp.]MCB9971064.1 MFS transporter [Hyphomonas sp.]